MYGGETNQPGNLSGTLEALLAGGGGGAGAGAGGDAAAVAAALDRQERAAAVEAAHAHALAAQNLLRRASMPATSGLGVGAGGGGGGGMTGGGAGGLGGGGGSSVLERAIAVRTQQRQKVMQLHRQMLAANTGAGAGAGSGVATPRASLGLGSTQPRARHASLGLGMADDTPGSPAALLSQLQGTGGGGGPPSRTAELLAVRNQLIEQAQIQERRNSLLAMSLQRQADENAAAERRFSLAGAEMGGDSNPTDRRDLEAAEAFLHLSGKPSPSAAGAGDLTLADAGGPRRVSMDTAVHHHRDGSIPGLTSAAAHRHLLGEVGLYQRRLSDAAASLAMRQRRSTLPMSSTFGMNSALDSSAAFDRKRTLDDLRAQAQQLHAAAGPSSSFPLSNSGASMVPEALGKPVPTTGARPRRPPDAPRRPLSAYNFFFIDERERVLRHMKNKDGEEKDNRGEEKDGNDNDEGGESDDGAAAEKKKDGEEKDGEESGMVTESGEAEGNADHAGGSMSEDEGGDANGDAKKRKVDAASSSASNAFTAKTEEEKVVESIPLPEDDATFTPSSYEELMTLRLNNKDKPRPHRKTHGKIGFQTLAKLIAQRWKTISEERKGHYKDLAQIDMQHYKAKTAAYQAKIKLQNQKYRGGDGGGGGGAMGDDCDSPDPAEADRPPGWEEACKVASLQHGNKNSFP